MSKYVRVMNGLESDASKYKFKLNEVNEAKNWYKEDEKTNPTGGFYFSTEEGIIRWLLRGDTIYDVTIPEDAFLVKENNTRNIVFRANKIIISNPKKITDEYAIELYKKSNLPEDIYFRIIGILAMCGYEKASKVIIDERINEKNIKEAIDYYISTNIYLNEKRDRKAYNKILKILKEKYK